MTNWKESLIGPKSTLEYAIRNIHKVGLRIALVVDDQEKLLGTITDGDIRRSLLSSVGMDCTVDKIMNASPTIANLSDDRSDILSLMKDKNILHIPIVDSEGIICGLEVLQDILQVPPLLNNPVFLMAGGFGTRLYPLTKDTPKPLLKVGEKPILEIILEQFIKHGFHRFFISVHYKGEMIKDHFGDGSKWNVSIEYIDESSPLGTAGALGLLPNNDEELPFIVMNGDVLTNLDFRRLIEFHSSNNALATLCVREYDIQVPYGVTEIHNEKVQSIIEKPIHKFFVNAGVYVLNSKLVYSVRRNKHLDMTTLLEMQLNNGEVISSFPIHEYWIDIGQVDQYEKANLDIYD